MSCRSIRVFWHRSSMAIPVSSVPLSLTIVLGCPRRTMIAVSSCVTRRPENGVSASSAGHARLQSSAMASTLTRRRGRYRREARLEADTSFGHWRTQTFIAGLRVDEPAAPWLLHGPMNRAAFETYIETQLAPVLLPGDGVIAHNLAAHKSARVNELLPAQGNRRLFLPPYAPDLNPIEMAYSKLKAHLTRMTCEPSTL